MAIMENTINLTLSELENLLHEQKKLVIAKLADHTGYWNADSDKGNYRTVNINMENFTKQGMGALYPNDFMVLKKYLNKPSS